MKKKDLSPPPSQIELLFALAEEQRHQKRSVSEIMATFQGAGILDKKGNFTKPYSHLARVVTDI
jgi:hypothetical protein